jgi:hypothetical protein
MSDRVELLERFRRGPEVVAATLTGAAGSEVDYRPAPDDWSLRQIVAHLADSEIIGSVRFRRTLAEENPTIEWCDEKAWAERLDYARRKYSASLETFRRIRSENYELLKDQADEAWSRPCLHSKCGPMTLYDLLKMYAEHAESHAMQIRRVRGAFKSLRTGTGA